MNKVFAVILGSIGLGVIFLWFSYNSLASKTEAVENQWAQVGTQYQRRFDLIPNLVESVKGVMGQEQKIFSELAQARSGYASAKTSDQKVAAATQLEGSFSRLLAIVESYPQLASSDNIKTLMAQLEGTENRVSVERHRYNDAVRSLNTTLKTFPSNIVAGFFGFGPRAYFEVTAGAQEVPQVKLT
jgi:LemA protein